MKNYDMNLGDSIIGQTRYETPKENAITKLLKEGQSAEIFRNLIETPRPFGDLSKYAAIMTEYLKNKKEKEDVKVNFYE